MTEEHRITSEDKWKKKIDEIARSIPEWDKHWKDYKERHPEESMPNVFKKASFTRRMQAAKLVKKMVKEMFEEIAQEINTDNANE